MEERERKMMTGEERRGPDWGKGLASGDASAEHQLSRNSDFPSWASVSSPASRAMQGGTAPLAQSGWKDAVRQCFGKWSEYGGI